MFGDIIEVRTIELSGGFEGESLTVPNGEIWKVTANISIENSENDYETGETHLMVDGCVIGHSIVIDTSQPAMTNTPVEFIAEAGDVINNNVGFGGGHHDTPATLSVVVMEDDS